MLNDAVNPDIVFSFIRGEHNIPDISITELERLEDVEQDIASNASRPLLF